ncbi:MAG TPA: GNAT family protein [Polyangiaceae bacterium]|nr:GNAT family protein [Polyangiaceae bacterium]
MQAPVFIRPLVLGDVPAVYAAVDESRAELRPWMPWCTPTFDEAAVAAFVENSALDRQVGRAFEFGVFDVDGEFLGNCGLNSVNAEYRFANLGYWIRTPRTRRGFATSAVHELAQWGFSNTPLDRFEIIAALENVASQRVAERAGALREGTLRRRLVLGGRAHDAAVYSIVRSE